MIIRIWIGYIIGYLGITIEGYYIERFINMCRSNKIAIWHLKRKKEIQLDFRVGIQDFKEICRIAKKTKCKRGLPFLLHRYKKRKIFFVFLLLMISLTVLSSYFVWNVDIVEENGQELENIEKDIEAAGLKIGEWKGKINGVVQ